MSMGRLKLGEHVVFEGEGAKRTGVGEKGQGAKRTGGAQERGKWTGESFNAVRVYKLSE